MKQCLCGRSKTYPYCDNTHKIKKDMNYKSEDLNKKTDIKLKIEEANKTGQVLFLKGFMKKSPDWKDFIELIDHQYNNPLTNENTEQVFKERLKNKNTQPQFVVNKKNINTNIQHFQSLSMEMWFVRENGLGIENKDRYQNSSIDEFLYFFHKDKTVTTLKCLINFAGNQLDGHIHSDYQDVVSWTCAGEIEYRIYKVDRNFERHIISNEESKNLEYDSYIMTAGDVIYMPKGTYHKAIAHKPRASLILDYPHEE